ncbi:MAG: four helix bundle protein [Kofleriaceae bacterium]
MAQPPQHRELAIQQRPRSLRVHAPPPCVRAATSITLNVSEGSKRAGKDRRRFYVMAQGSAQELRGALDTADDLVRKVRIERLQLLHDRREGADELECIRVRVKHCLSSFH